MEYFVDFLINVGVLVVGLGLGAHFSVSIDKAIAAVTAAETSARATLAKITAHKAS